MKQYTLTEDEFNSLVSIATEKPLPVMKIGNNWTEDTRPERIMSVWGRVAQRLRLKVDTISPTSPDQTEYTREFLAEPLEEEVAP